MAVGQDKGGVAGGRRAKAQIDFEYVAKKPAREDVGGLARRGDLPPLHDDKLVGIGGGEMEIVEDRQDGDAAVGDLAGDVHQHQSMPQIETGDRLVEIKRLTAFAASAGGKLTKHAGEMCPLLFSAR